MRKLFILFFCTLCTFAFASEYETILNVAAKQDSKDYDVSIEVYKISQDEKKMITNSKIQCSVDMPASFTVDEENLSIECLINGQNAADNKHTVHSSLKIKEGENIVHSYESDIEIK